MLRLGQAHLGAILAGLCCGCSSAPVTILIPFEVAETSAVVAVVEDGRTQFYGVDAGLRAAQPVLHSVSSWDGQAKIEVHVAYFRQSLEALGLEPGVLQSAGEGSGLPVELRTLTAVLDGGDAAVWTTPPKRAEALDAFKLAEESPCVALATAGPRLMLEFDERPIRFVQGSDERVWLVSALGPTQFGRVREVTASTLGDPIEMPQDFRARAAVGLPDGRVLVGGGSTMGAQVLIGQPGGALVSLATLAGAPSFRWPTHMARVLGSAADDPVYGLSPGGQVLKISEGILEVVADTGETGNYGGLVALARDDLLVLRPDGQAVLRVLNGAVIPEMTVLDSLLLDRSDRTESILHVDGFGTFLGMDQGQLLKRTTDRWEVAEENVLVASTIEVMSAFRGGLAVTGRYGIVDQYYEPDGYCVPERLFIGNDATVHQILAVGEQLVLVADDGLPQGQRGYFVQTVGSLAP